MGSTRIGALVLVALAACGGGEARDGGLDATSGSDSGIDAARGDAGSDSGTDAGCVDADGDGHAAMSCGGDDCDDADAHRYPGNAEVCDATNHDEDCDAVTFGFRDADGDGYPDVRCCNATAAGGMNCGSDCDDANTNVHPSQTETCNGVDDNCNGMIDEGAVVSYFADCDHDGHGAGTPMMGCTPPTTAPSCPGGTWLTVGGDCDDTDPAASPGLTEVCDTGTRDEDCDPATNGGVDADGDGATQAICCNPQPSGSVLCGTDCDDTRAAVHVGASETCNHVDDDCDGTIDDGVGGCAADASTGITACGATLTCTLSTDECCTALSGATPACAAAGSTCPASRSIPVACDGPEDCGAGLGCFGSFAGGGPTRAACLTNGSYRLCHYDVQCPVGRTCMASVFASWIHVCM